MDGTSRPRGRPPGSKNKNPRASKSAPKGGANSSSSGPTPSSSNVPSKAPSTSPPALPRNSLPPSVLATLERPSVANFARTHAIFTGPDKVSKKKFVGDVKEFARAKGVSDEFVKSCVGEAKELLKKRKEAKAAEPEIKQEVVDEPAQENKPKKHKKKKDHQVAPASTQETAIKQEEAEEPSTEHKKSKRKKDKTSEAASTQPGPATQADDDKTSKKRKKKDKARESAVNPVSAEIPTTIKSEEPPTETKKSKEKKSKNPKHGSAAPEQRPTETPIPLPTMTRTETPKDLENGAQKSKSTKKRKRDASDDGGSKPESRTAVVPDAPASSKKKKHSKSSHESEPESLEGKKAKKERKHKPQPVARSPSPPPRKKTKREHKDGETTHLASTAQNSSHKSHEQADKGKEKKIKKAKSEKKHHVSTDPPPGSSKSTAPEGELEQERDEPPTTHAQSEAPTPRSSKKKRRKEKRERRQSEPHQTQPARQKDESEVETASKKPEPESERQSEKKKSKKKRKSMAASESSGAIPPTVAQLSPAKPSSKHVSGTPAFGSEKAPPKRKRSPSPPSSPPHKESSQDNGRKLSLNSSASVFHLPALTQFANDTLILPEPPQGLSASGRKRWKKKMRKSILQIADEVPVDASSDMADSAQQMPHGGAEMGATSNGDSGRSNKPVKKKARMEHKAGDPSPRDDAASEVPIASAKQHDSARKQPAVPKQAVEKPSVTATGSFAHETPLPPISSPQRPASANQAAAIPEAPSSPPQPDLQGWDALPAQYVSGSDSELDAHDATDLEPDTPVRSLKPPQQAGDEDADSESTESESDAESESGPESEAEAPAPRLPTPIRKTASQVATPSQRSFADTFTQPASLRPQPLLSMSQLKACTPSLSQSRGGVPLKPKSPPKTNVNVDILGIAHGSDESDDESSESSSDNDDGNDETQKQAETSSSKPATLRAPISHSSKPLAEPTSHSQKDSVQTGRGPSTAPGSSLSKTGPRKDGADEKETASESSDDASGDEEAAKTDNKKLASPRTQTQISQAIRDVGKAPEQLLLPKSDGIADVTSITKSFESEDEDGSTASESDHESDEKSTTKDKESVSPPSHSPQRDKAEPARKSPREFKSPANIPLRPLSKTEESPKANTGMGKSSEPAESEEHGLDHAKGSSSINTTVEPPTVEALAEVARGDEDLGLPKSPNMRDAPRSGSKRALNTPSKRRPTPHRGPVVLQSNQAKSPTANDIINGIALTGSRAASSVAGDEPQAREASTLDPNAQEPQTNQTPEIDQYVQAESSPDADGESLLLPENSNQEHDVSPTDNEPSDPLLKTPSKPPSSPLSNNALPLQAADAIDDGRLNMGQNESLIEQDGGHVKKEVESSPCISPAPKQATITHHDAPSSPPRLQNSQFGTLSGRGRKTQPKPPNRKSTLRRELGIDPDTPKREDSAEEGGEIRNSCSAPNGPKIIDLDESPSYFRLPNGRFASLSERKTKATRIRARSRAPDRIPSGQFSVSSDGKQKQEWSHRKARSFLLRELSIDSDIVKEEETAEQQGEDAPRLTHGSTERPRVRPDPVDAPQNLTRSSRLRSKNRVSYRQYLDLDENLDSDEYHDSDESVAETAAREQSSARKKTSRPSSRRLLSSSRPSRSARSPSPESNDDLQFFTSSPIRSTFFGVVIPSSQGGVVSAPLPGVRDGKSAAEQHKDAVASTADAHQTNDVDPREPGAAPLLLDGARGKNVSAADDDEGAEDQPDHHDDRDDEGVVSSNESLPRPVFTVSFSGTQDAAEEEFDSDKEEVDEAEPHPNRETSSAHRRQHSASKTEDDANSTGVDSASPSSDKRDSSVDEEGKPESSFETKAQDETQECQDEKSIGEDEDQVSDASSRGSAYSFDDDPRGFLNEDGTISGQATPRRRTGFQSNHFTTIKDSRPPPGTVSCLPFPPTTAEKFGLIQEELADYPLNLLIAVMLLNKTKGSKAIPKYWELMERYQTRDELIAANLTDLTALLKPLGLQSRRASQLLDLCRQWVCDPPTKGTRHRVLNYPFKGAHKDIRSGEIITDSDPRLAAFEVCHLPGVGDYALDSWRIFCRDKFRGLANGYNGEGAEPHFEPEWKRVQPNDKELRAFLRWMWLREGWIWDPETGNKKRASEDETTANELEKMRWDQEAGEEVQVTDSEAEDVEEAPNGYLQGSPAKDSSPPKSLSSDGPSSQLVREQRNRASQSQLQQSQAQRTPKETATVSSTAPAALPTRLRPFGRTTTTTTTSTSSSPASAHRLQPTPLDLLGENDDPDFNLAGLFRTPYGYRKRSSSAKWATRGVVEETPPGSPRQGEPQPHQNNRTDGVKDREQESDMENFGVIGNEEDDPGMVSEGHREGGDDEHDEKARSSGAAADAGLSSGSQSQGNEKQGPEQQPSVEGQADEGTASQESNKSCCVM